jgi:hypothetical protein
MALPDGGPVWKPTILTGTEIPNFLRILMTNTTDTVIPACPDPTLWEFTVYKADRRTKTGWRKVEDFTANLSDSDAALRALDVPTHMGYRVEYRKYWVLKHGLLPPHNAFWEPWNTPHYCSPSSETYYTT